MATSLQRNTSWIICTLMQVAGGWRIPISRWQSLGESDLHSSGFVALCTPTCYCEWAGASARQQAIQQVQLRHLLYPRSGASTPHSLACRLARIPNSGVESVMGDLSHQTDCCFLFTDFGLHRLQIPHGEVGLTHFLVTFFVCLSGMQWVLSCLILILVRWMYVWEL